MLASSLRTLGGVGAEGPAGWGVGVGREGAPGSRGDRDTPRAAVVGRVLPTLGMTLFAPSRGRGAREG